MAYIQTWLRVKAIRDGKTFKKDAKGTLIRQGAIDSENYYFIKLDDGKEIGPSLEDYWEEDKELLPINTRVTHFDGGESSHGKGTIVAYNGTKPLSYAHTNIHEAAEMAGEVGLLDGLVNSFYDGVRCPYFVHWDVNPRKPEHPNGYQDVYERTSVRFLPASEDTVIVLSK